MQDARSFTHSKVDTLVTVEFLLFLFLFFYLRVSLETGKCLCSALRGTLLVTFFLLNKHAVTCWRFLCKSSEKPGRHGDTFNRWVVVQEEIFSDFIRDEILDVNARSCHPNHIMFFCFTCTHTHTCSPSIVLYLAAGVYIVSPWERSKTKGEYWLAQREKSNEHQPTPCPPTHYRGKGIMQRIGWTLRTQTHCTPNQWPGFSVWQPSRN